MTEPVPETPAEPDSPSAEESTRSPRIVLNLPEVPGRVLTDAREKLNLSVEAFAYYIGIHPEDLAALEAAKVLPRFAHLVLIGVMVHFQQLVTASLVDLLGIASQRPTISEPTASSEPQSEMLCETCGGPTVLVHGHYQCASGPCKGRVTSPCCEGKSSL